MSINNTDRISLNNAPAITHNVNLSLDNGTSHIHATATNETLLEDAKDGVDIRA